MNKINKFMIMVIAMVVIMVIAVIGNRGYEAYQAKVWEKERASRYTEAAAQVHTMTATIAQMSEGETALQALIDEAITAVDEFEEEIVAEVESSISGNTVSGDGLSSPEDVSWADDGAGSNVMISGNEILTLPEAVSGNAAVSGNSFVSGNSLVSGNSFVSGNAIPSYDNISWTDNGAGTGGANSQIPSGNEELTLKEKRQIMGSYQQTLLVNEADKEIIENSDLDFSDIKIACLGDSITAASNLDSEDNYQQYSYPTQLDHILGAASITNLGIGGSSIGRYWDNAFVDRYQAIPSDTDLIIVMGGTNDGFCVTEEERGNMEERKPDTFVGDLDELMRGLKADYPDATIVFATPLPNILHDILRKDRDYLLPQVRLVTVIKDLAAEYEIPVIDLYNSNILDTHDAAVISSFMPDGVHGNHTGYEIMADHFAAGLIQIYDEQKEES